MIGSLWILNRGGDILIEKHWRGLKKRTFVDTFWKEVSKVGNPKEVLPVIAHTKGYFVHKQHLDIFLLATMEKENPPLAAIELLNDMVDIFQDYFKRVDEANLKMNFVTVYSILDEMLDNGIPFNTMPSMLKDMIPPPNLVKDIVDKISGPSSVMANLSSMGSDHRGAQVQWRRAGIKHSPNEVYLDIIEEIDATLDAQGMVITSEVVGNVQVSSKLSGMPDLTLLFQNARIMDDVSLHKCVRYKSWHGSRVVSFVPPDGDFRLMSYRVHSSIHIPVYVRPQIHFGKTGGSVNVMVGQKHHTDKLIENVVLRIPFPESIAGARVELSANYGRVVYDEMTKVCTWEIGKILRDKAPSLSGNISLATGASPPESKPTIEVEYLINMWSASSIKVDALTVRGVAYKPYKGVRTITKTGRFLVRC